MIPILTIIIQIILQTCLNALLLLLAMVKTYHDEKSKNLATKEDIAEITRKVEEVKSELQFKNQMRLSLRTEEKKSAVDYYEKISLLYSKLKVKYFGFDEDNYNDLNAEIIKLEILYDEAVTSEARMTFYIQDTDIRSLANQATSSLLNLYESVVTDILSYKSLLFEHGVRLKKVANSTRPEIDAVFEIHHAELKTHIDKSLLPEPYEAALDKIYAFRIACYQHILDMEESEL